MCDLDLDMNNYVKYLRHMSFRSKFIVQTQTHRHTDTQTHTQRPTVLPEQELSVQIGIQMIEYGAKMTEMPLLEKIRFEFCLQVFSDKL